MFGDTQEEGIDDDRQVYKYRELEAKEKEVTVMEREVKVNSMKIEEEVKAVIQDKNYQLALQRLNLKNKGILEEEINRISPIEE